ncbi:MAG: hypothetical protein M5U34_00920 [Chloroflexi bacterium]|nr:hypothetical protein [Chloroflexota bacterium]
MTITAELAQEAVNFLIGHSGEIGFTENLHHWGQAGVMISGTAAVGATLLEAYPLAGICLGLGGLIGEVSKETSDTLAKFASLLQAEIDAGATSISIEVDSEFFGDKITVRGQNVTAIFSPRLTNEAGKFIKDWMLFYDNGTSVQADGLFGTYYWRSSDGSIAFP